MPNYDSDGEASVLCGSHQCPSMNLSVCSWLMQEYALYTALVIHLLQLSLHNQRNRLDNGIAPHQIFDKGVQKSTVTRLLANFACLDRIQTTMLDKSNKCLFDKMEDQHFNRFLFRRVSNSNYIRYSILDGTCTQLLYDSICRVPHFLDNMAITLGPVPNVFHEASFRQDVWESLPTPPFRCYHHLFYHLNMQSTLALPRLFL